MKTISSGYYGEGNQTSVEIGKSAKQLGTGFMINQDTWEPQRTNNFELVIEGLDRIVMANGNIYKVPDAMDRIMLSVASFTAPSLEIDRITTHYANNSIKWAGKPNFPDSSIVINDYIGVGTEEVLSAWFRAAYDFKSEKVGLAKDYKKTAYLIEYAPQGGTPRIWKLDGCWIAQFQLGEWSQEGNQQRQLSATFIYDRIIPDYRDENIGEEKDGKSDVTSLTFTLPSHSSVTPEPTPEGTL